MKSILTALLLFVASMVAYADMTNGSFYIDNPVECHFIQQNGTSITNQLVAGETYIMNDTTMMEMVSSNKTSFFFSNGLLVEAGSNSVITINLFDQEVKNLFMSPRKSEVGNFNLIFSIGSGEISIISPITDSNSLFTITTPLVSYQVSGGKYFFRVTNKSSIAFVVEGFLEVHGDKRVDKTEAGKLAIAAPFVDPLSGLEDKIITSFKTLPKKDADKFAESFGNIEKKVGNIHFFVYHGKQIGISMKD